MTRTPKPNPVRTGQKCPANKIEVKTAGISLLHECKENEETPHNTHECFCGKAWTGGAES